MGDPHRKLARQKLKKHSRKAEEPSPSNRCNFVHVFIKMKNAFQLCVMMRSAKKEFLIKTLQLRKLRVILRSRVLRGVYTHPREGYRPVTPLLIMPGSTGLRR